ncbi:hypothetical protein [Labrenzia sp. 011]|uniref:hypothetical protein n=1 Tax=Labrenzia sp. 011 TaxID=2171494 RepID=UPI000D521E59|nr:hypothetical protein [Labrenzia sp. 011]PVB60206.1 hypothetical protein DCO57_18095 [Labrenzia sp. 011]
MHANNSRKQSSVAGFALGSGLVFGVICLTGLSAEAQTRRQPDTTRLTCAQTQALIEKFGAINLKSGPYKFDRYVAGRTQCVSAGRDIRTTYVPTSDDTSCPVKVCIEQGQQQ